MGLFKRAKFVANSKASAALDKMEDPAQTLDYSYQQQQEMLVKVKRGLADVATSRRRLELQMQELQSKDDKLVDQAKRALAAGRQDLAREALGRRAAIQGQISDLSPQLASLTEQEEKLDTAQRMLTAKVAAFGTQKETLKAQYAAGKAIVGINETVAGISEEMGASGAALTRAQDKIQNMTARATALDELMASGALEPVLGGGGDDIERQLAEISGPGDVDGQLAAMMRELAPPAQAPAAIEAAPVHVDSVQVQPATPRSKRFDPSA